MNEASWFRAEPCQTHKIVHQLIVDYVHCRNVNIDTIVDLWTMSGELLKPLTKALNPRKSYGLVAPGVKESHESDYLRDNIELIEAQPDGVNAGWFPSPDLIVGIPPQRWKPKYFTKLSVGDQKTEVTDDPANIAIIDACQKLSPGGLGCFVVGPGMLMRPGPGTILANLEKFNLNLDGVIVLPQGSTRPNIGAGQNLLVLSKTRRNDPFTGRLTWSSPLLSNVVSKCIHPRYEPKNTIGTSGSTR